MPSDLIFRLLSQLRVAALGPSHLLLAPAEAPTRVDPGRRSSDN